MARRWDAKGNPLPDSPVTAWDEQGRPIARSPAKMSRPESGVVGAGAAGWFGFDDEAFGGLMAAMAAVHGDNPAGIYERARDDWEARKKKAKSDNPTSYTIGQVAGGVATGGPGVGAVKGLAPRALAASGIGAVQGGLTGYGEGDTPDERARGALQGAEFGAALGPLFVLGGKAAEPVLRPIAQKTRGAIQDIMRRQYEEQISRRSSVLGGLYAPRAPQVDPTIAKLAERAGGAGAIRENAAAIRASGQNPILAQALGDPGLSRADAYVTMPGKTRTLAGKVISGRRQGAGQRLNAALGTLFGSKTRQDIREQAAEAYKILGPQYNELLSSVAIPREKANGLLAAWGKIPYAEQSKALKRAQAISAYDFGEDGFDRMPLAQQFHYIKMALGERIEALGRKGTAGVQRQRLTVVQKALREEMEGAIPGYKDLNNAWADEAQQEEAITWAKKLFGGNVLPEEAKATFNKMTDAQKSGALADVLGQLNARLMNATKTGERSRNVADPFLTDMIEKRLRAILGDEKTQSFMSAVHGEDVDFNTLGSIGGNSKTAQRGAEILDDMMAGLPGKPGARQMAGAVLKAPFDAINEARRDKLGAELLKELTPDEEEKLVRLLNERQRSRGDVRAVAASVGASSARAQ